MFTTPGSAPVGVDQDGLGVREGQETCWDGITATNFLLYHSLHWLTSSGPMPSLTAGTGKQLAPTQSNWDTYTHARINTHVRTLTCIREHTVAQTITFSKHTANTHTNNHWEKTRMASVGLIVSASWMAHYWQEAEGIAAYHSSFFRHGKSMFTLKGSVLGTDPIGRSGTVSSVTEKLCFSNIPFLCFLFL